MIKYYETFEVKIDPSKCIERMRGPKSVVSNDESGFPLKNGWGCCEYDSWRGKEDYYELRIYPDGTCIKIWRYDSTDECGTVYGSFKKPYDELVSILENGDSITTYLEWDDDLPF
jgi:hypothetical protein